MKCILLGLALVSSVAFGWGELGHHLVGRLSATLVCAHPLLKDRTDDKTKAFCETFRQKRYQQGHLGNIPDTHWRALPKEQIKFGDESHYLDLDFFPSRKVPLAWKQVVGKGKEAGTLPWRTQQFYDLYVRRLKTYAADQKGTATREALTYAGLLSHFTADVSMPLHASSDFDAVKSQQKGLHWYFENHLVDALEPELEPAIVQRAEALLTPLGLSDAHAVSSVRAKARQTYPTAEKDGEVAAMILVVLEDSFGEIENMKRLDRTFAIIDEKNCNEDKNCRRAPAALVDPEGKPLPGGDAKNAKTVAQWNRELILERLALSVALTTDLWVRGWIAAGEPMLVETRLYGARPSFVSPSDSACAGYLSTRKPSAQKVCVTF